MFEAEALSRAGWACALVPSDVLRRSAASHIYAVHHHQPAAEDMRAFSSRRGFCSDILVCLEKIGWVAHEGGTCFLLGPLINK